MLQEIMKMNNTIKTVLVAALAISALSSCTKNFPSFNKDPHNASPEDMIIDDKMSGNLFQQLERSVFVYRDGTMLDSDYQIMSNLCSDTWCGYFAPTLGNGTNTGSFYPMDGWTRSTFVNKYTYGMGAYIQLAKFAKENELNTILALADVLKVTTMHHCADYYGPIPYSEAGNLTPKYDSLEDIYKQFFAELDAAIEVLESAGAAPVMPKYDIVYQGDVTKWIKFANSLRLRLAMRVVYADEALAKTEAEKSFASSYGLLETNADNAYIHGADHHPVYEINVNFNDADTQIGASLDCYLNGYQDPRGAAFVKPAANDGKIHGVRPGIAVDAWTPYKNPAGNISIPNSEKYLITWMNAAEVAFLRAEAALRGWNAGGDAESWYNKGIELSFDEWGVSGASAYSQNTTLKPAAFVDVIGSAGAPAPSTVTIKYNANASFENRLEQIATQKWIALFPNGAEAWAEYRRLHYPGLVTPAQNKSNNAVNTNQQIRRVNYPVSEQTDNPTGYASGVAALGGQDNGGTRLWWDKKPF